MLQRIQVLTLAFLVLGSSLTSCSDPEVVSPTGKTTASPNQLAPPDDPPVVCNGNCPPQPTDYRPIFVTSEGSYPFNDSGAYNGADNPNGYILDIKAIVGDYPYNHIQGPLPLDGYTLLPINLNSGNNGKYIYLIFTRIPASVRHVPTSTSATEAPVRLIEVSRIYNFMATSTLLLEGKLAKAVDLNEGTNDPGISAALNRVPSTGTPIELGVYYSQAGQTATAPSGWQLIPTNANEATGGDWIYICYKHR
jgi:hypothetical protein